MSRKRSSTGREKSPRSPATRIEVQTGPDPDSGVPSAPAPFVSSSPTSVPGAVSTANYRRVAMSQPRKGVGVGAFLLAVVTVGALVHVAVRIKGLEVAYALGRERKVATELEEQRRRLQIEIGMLKDPGRVVQFARDKLKMGPPAPDAIVALAAAGSLTNTVAPTPLALGNGKGAPGPKAKPAMKGTVR
jgi:cell division protein FtsL